MSLLDQTKPARVFRVIVRNGDTFEHDGRTWEIEIEADPDHGAPWEESDGHGPVSDWQHGNYYGRPNKAPGERVLSRDRGSFRTYDFAEAVRIARRDGWGTAGGRKEGETARAYAARAVEEDFERLRQWCDDQWCYVGVIVHELEEDEEGDYVRTGRRASLWGIESDSHEHIAEVARELTGEIS